MYTIKKELNPEKSCKPLNIISNNIMNSKRFLQYERMICFSAKKVLNFLQIRGIHNMETNKNKTNKKTKTLQAN